MGSNSKKRSKSPSKKRRSLLACSLSETNRNTTFSGLSAAIILLVASSSIVIDKTQLGETIAFVKPVEKPISNLYSFAEKLFGRMEDQSYDEPVQYEQDYPKFAYSSFNRPMGLRWRDDSKMMNNFGNVATMMPVLTEHRSASPFRRASSPNRPTTSNRFDYRSDYQTHGTPSLEDLDLIDVLWRRDIAIEKGSRQVAPSEQYKCDLQMLTEKSSVAPLTAKEHARYEDLSKGFYQDFYPAFNNKVNNVKPREEEFDIPTDEDLADLLDDVSKEEGQLNSLFENNQQPIVNNISLVEGVVYNQNNITEMNLIREQAEQLSTSSSSRVDDSSLFNSTDPNFQHWLQPSDMSPDDVFPNSQYTYVPMQNDSNIPIVSNGNVEYDHSYQNPRFDETIGVSTNLNPTFDSYHSNRLSYSDCTDSSSTCSRLSSESPKYQSEPSSENSIPVTRFYGKLVPKESRLDRIKSKIARIVPIGGANQRKRGRQSKDEQLANDNRLPVSAKEISEMTLAQLQNVLKMEKLSEAQKQLIRKIRRRGKNKVAARTCRQRRSDRYETTINMSSYI